MNKSRSSLRLTIGPLRYRFLAHDAWGEEALARLRKNVECVTFRGPPDRVIHLTEFHPTLQEGQRMEEHLLPESLAKLLPGSPPCQGWKRTDDATGHFLWCHPATRHTIWTYGLVTAHHRTSFQLPWQPMLEDIVQLGGGIIHGGLAVLDGRGYLFSAPPGGGKTTALSRIPLPWRVLADDAALVWPAGESVFRASPLPTWGVLIHTLGAIQGISRWKVATSLEISGVILLTKASAEKLSSLGPIAAAQRLYRAFSEHPRVILNRGPLRKNLFHTACDLARALPSWDLQLTRTGAYWNLLREAFADA